MITRTDFNYGSPSAFSAFSFCHKRQYSVTETETFITAFSVGSIDQSINSGFESLPCVRAVDFPKEWSNLMQENEAFYCILCHVIEVYWEAVKENFLTNYGSKCNYTYEMLSIILSLKKDWLWDITIWLKSWRTYKIIYYVAKLRNRE